MINKKFWRGKRVFVTGHSGFKGTWLTHWLGAVGAKVIGYSKDVNYQQQELAKSTNDILESSIYGDICDFDNLLNCMTDAEPDILFHLAAQPLVKKSFFSAPATFETNVMGTINLLECAKNVPSLRSVVIVTSDKCYKNVDAGIPFNEEDPLGGDDPYSASKACAEIATQSYMKSFFSCIANTASQTNIATARAGNIIGGGDWGEYRLIPDIARAMASGDVVQIRSPLAVRPWQFVLDALCGYMMLAEKLFTDGEVYTGSWNFGPNEYDCWNVEAVVNAFCGNNGPSVHFERNSSERQKEKLLLSLNSTKAEKKLGWHRKVPLHISLSWTRRWYEESISGKSARALCREHLKQYNSIM